MNTTTWRPILDGPEREAALDAVHAIARALEAYPEERLRATLSGGAAGVSLFFCHLAKQTGAEAHRDLCEHYAALAMDGLSEGAVRGLGLYGGATGIAWLLAHLRGEGYPIAPDATEGVDALLLEALTPAWSGEDFDLVSGLVGFGAYALEGELDDRRHQILDRVLAQLIARAEPRACGLSWVAPPVHLDEGRGSSEGGDNFGVAHGTPGAIALLGTAVARDLFAREARPVLEGAVQWLVAHEQAQHAHRRYAYSVVDPERRARLAWCYGDPGIAVALFGAARGLGDPSLAARAEALLASSTRCPPEESGVEDAGLCHGALGLALLFNRIGQATGSSVLIEGARAWVARALAMRGSHRGIGGFQARYLGEWVDDPGFLMGAAGIGLALLAAVSDAAPRWDHPLTLLG